MLRVSEIEEYLKSGASESTKEYISDVKYGIREINMVCQKYKYYWLTIEPLLDKNDYIYHIDPCAPPLI